VRLWFASTAYPRGKMVTALALLVTLALLAAPLWNRWRNARHG
jgi:hypothetical protein